jgi:hypothetical protein
VEAASRGLASLFLTLSDGISSLLVSDLSYFLLGFSGLYYLTNLFLSYGTGFFLGFSSSPNNLLTKSKLV